MWAVMMSNPHYYCVMNRRASGYKPANVALALIVALVVFTLVLNSQFLSRRKPFEVKPSRQGNVSNAPRSKAQKCLDTWGKEHQDDAKQMNKKPWSCPEEMPAELHDQYTQGGQIAVTNWYKCQTGPQYDKEHKYEKEQIEEYVGRIEKRLVNFYGTTDTMLYRALDAHPIKGKDVVIMGSQRPIYESVCLVFGGSSCTTIDFQPIIVNYPKLRTMTIAQYDENPIQFDAAFSISSFEHDGLGRYGDPLRPDGDIHMMSKMKCILKEGGILYLSVPIALDKIVWNMHRVYGRVRLPKLIEHWTLLDVVADHQMTMRWTGCDSNKEGDYQPILVLKNAEQPTPGHNQQVLNKYLDKNPEKYEGVSCFGEAL